MVINGQIIDNTTKRGVPYATIELTDQNGVYLGFGVSADNDGNFDMDAPMAQPGTFLRISSAEYLTTSIPYKDYTSMYYFFITPKVTDLPPVVVTATAGKKSDLSFMLLGGLALLAYVITKKR